MLLVLFVVHFKLVPHVVRVLVFPTHKEYFQGQTTRLTYSDAGQGWEHKDSNYMWNKFEVDNKAYEKHEADIAKMMSGKM